MKKCPNCHMIVDTHNECPVCEYDLVNEPQSDLQFEKYRLNKYFVTYLLKKHKFALFCTAVVLVSFVTVLKSFSYWQIISIFLILITWYESLYKKRSFQIFSNIYSDAYLELTNKITIYASGILAIILAFL